jgi:pimeloyl-ACP methyl ester carboxylesterase
VILAECAETRIQVDRGVTLAVRASRLGPGVPVLMVHGLSSNARLWDAVAGRLADLGHPVAAVDQRGHGRSDKPDTGYDWLTLTADLAAVIDGLGWHRPLAAGQSWGGNVVLELAINHPDTVRAIACVDGGMIELARRFPNWEAAREALRPPQLTGLPVEEFEATIRRMHPNWPETGIAATVANVEVRADGTIAPWLSLDHHLAILRQLWEHKPSARYPLVPVPVLLIPAGDGSLDEVAEAQAGLPHARTRSFPGADHDIHAQHPVELADLLHAACQDDFWLTDP